VKIFFFMVVFFINVLSAQEATPKETFYNHMNSINSAVKIMDPRLWEVVKQWDSYYKSEAEKRTVKKPTFFYFFTLGDKDGDANTYLSYFNQSAAKLKNRNPEMRFYGVLNGMPKDQNRMKKIFLHEIENGSASKAGVKIKFFPSLFEDLNITQAPAYALAYCEDDFGSGRGCDFKYLVRGGVGMRGFIEMFEKDNVTYKGWLNDLNQAD